MAKILIMDDDSTIIELFRFVFEDAGHEVVTASNGALGLEVLKAHTPDFMVVDVSMPEMSGREFIVALGRMAVREPRLKGIPFVVMTGENYFETDLNRAFAVTPGFVSFFPKMTPPETVLEAAEKAIATRG